MKITRNYETISEHKSYVVVKTVVGSFKQVPTLVIKFAETLPPLFNFNSRHEDEHEIIRYLLEEGVLSTEVHFTNNVKDPLLLKKKIVEPALITRPIKILSVLYRTDILSVVLLVTALAHIWFFFFHTTFSKTYYNLLTLTLPEIFIIILLCTLISLMHELGHIAAQYAKTKIVGSIGIGMFTIFPVLYSDVSFINLCEKRSDKVIIMAAGVVMQLLVSSLFIIFLSGYNLASGIVFLTLINAISNLLPLYRSDGHWIVQDLLQTVDSSIIIKLRFIVNGLSIAALVTVIFWMLLLKNPPILTDYFAKNNYFSWQVAFILGQYVAAFLIISKVLLTRLRSRGSH